MPVKNALKTYRKNTFYHLFNRGVDGKKIFKNPNDYKTFLYLLEYYLSPPPKNKPFAKRKSLHKEIELLAFCLMPDHFHLLVKQKTKDGIIKLTRKLLTTYSMYFNDKYKRRGPLFEGRYKAVIVKTDEQLFSLSSFLHLNSHLAGLYTFKAYPYSSYPYFKGKEKASWINPNPILSKYNKTNKRLSYDQFLMEYLKREQRFDNSLTLEET